MGPEGSTNPKPLTLAGTCAYWLGSSQGLLPQNPSSAHWDLTLGLSITWEAEQAGSAPDFNSKD